MYHPFGRRTVSLHGPLSGVVVRQGGSTGRHHAARHRGPLGQCMHHRYDINTCTTLPPLRGFLRERSMRLLHDYDPRCVCLHRGRDGLEGSFVEVGYPRSGCVHLGYDISHDEWLVDTPSRLQSALHIHILSSPLLADLRPLYTPRVRAESRQNDATRSLRPGTHIKDVRCIQGGVLGQKVAALRSRTDVSFYDDLVHRVRQRDRAVHVRHAVLSVADYDRILSGGLYVDASFGGHLCARCSAEVCVGDSVDAVGYCIHGLLTRHDRSHQEEGRHVFR